MKKWIALLLCLALLLPLTGCGSRKIQNPGNFYYRNTSPEYGTTDGIITPEIRELGDPEEDLLVTMNTYFAGPQSRGLESPFPRDTQVLRYELEGRELVLHLNDAFSVLNGVDLTVACACMARTFLGFLPIDQVTVCVRKVPVNGPKNIVLTAENMMLTDDSLEQLRANYTVYYSDRKKRYLVGSDLSVSLADPEEIVRYLIQQLMTPPFSSELSGPIPYGTKLLDVKVKNGTCILNFSSEFDSNAFPKPESQRMTLLSIVNTVSQLEEIEQVEFYMEGNLLVQYGSLSISAPFVPEMGAVGLVRTGMNEFDTTLYVSNGPDQYLAPVPTKIRQTAGISQEELVMKALLEYHATNSFYSTIPRGTKLNHLATDDSTCHVDLSREFLSNPDHLSSAVHSIVASLCGVSSVEQVRITVDGKIPAGDTDGLFMVLKPQADWFV